MLNKSLSLQYLGKDDKAIECYDLILKSNLDDYISLNNKGVSLYKLGKYNEAIKYYGKALKIKPDFDMALKNKIIAEKKQRGFFYKLKNINHNTLQVGKK